MPPMALPGGRFGARCPLSLAISYAYKLPENPSVRLAGLPDWIRGDRRTQAGFYDIEATGPMPSGLSVQARDDRMRLMVQALLADRFQLAIHRETKVMPIYALVVGKGGRSCRRQICRKRIVPMRPPQPPERRIPPPVG